MSCPTCLNDMQGLASDGVPITFFWCPRCGTTEERDLDGRTINIAVPTRGIMSLWVITQNPSDFPGKFVLRRQWVTGDTIRYAPDADVCDTLAEARQFVPAGLLNIGRFPDDDPVIVEVWL